MLSLGKSDDQSHDPDEVDDGVDDLGSIIGFILNNSKLFSQKLCYTLTQ